MNKVTFAFRTFLLSILAAGASGAPALADRIVTKNGRVIEGTVVSRADGKVKFKLETAEIEVPDDMIKDLFIEGDMSGYVPKDDKEKELIAKGFVRYQNQWMPKAQYEQALAKEKARIKKVLEEEAKHVEWGNAWQFETTNFVFKGNCPKDILTDLSDLLQEYRKYMDSQIGMKASPSLQRTKMTVNVYRDEEDYLKSGGAPSGTGGYFSSMDQSLNFFYDFEDPGFTRQVMLHEGTHLLTYLSNPKFEPPSWINEGMAEYFSSARITGDRGKRKLEPGQILDNRLLVLQEMEKDRYIPIDKWLLYSDSYNNVSRAGGSPYEHYSYWWAFCHFLCTHKTYSKKFFQYFRDFYNLQGFERKAGYGGIGTGGVEFSVDPKHYTEKLLQALGVKDIKKLDEEFRAWIKAQAPVGARGYMYVGRDLSMQRKYDEAIEKLNLAIEKGYDTAETFVYRARCWAGKRNTEKEIEDLKSAIARNPVEPSFRSELAQAYSRRPDSKKLAMEQMKLAIELDPLENWYRFLLKRWEEEGKEKDGD